MPELYESWRRHQAHAAWYHPHTCPPGQSVHEAPQYALTAGVTFTAAAMRARKFPVTYTRPAFPCPRTCRNAATPADRREYL
jgi:hypothetical protein